MYQNKLSLYYNFILIYKYIETSAKPRFTHSFLPTKVLEKTKSGA